MEQNYKNHTRFSTPYHFFTVPTTLIGLGLAIYLFTQFQDLTHALIIIAFALIGLTLLFARFFALKAQDRGIFAQENLRYFSLTGKLLPKELRGSQIIALRFAPDEEFLTLVDRAVAEKLSSKAIKLSIKNWREDRYRL